MDNPFFKFCVVAFALLILPFSLFAQNGTITGKITDSETGELLLGVNVSIDGTNMGAATMRSGVYKITNVPPGTYTLKVTYIGYKEETQTAVVTVNTKMTINFKLESKVILGAAISVLADRAKLRETPVAFTDVKKQDMEARLGSQDIPLVLNTTPSVYATMQGGGAGDARVNVRGFNQRNVAIMINGVPVNDMENGWLYWSNWDGVADATSSIQIQRGLSAVNLAAPSIGGTMNIITDPTALQRGASFKQEIGNDGFLKSTISANTGLIDGKYAFSGTVVRKLGDGVIDKAWTDSWAYYFGGSYQINKDNRIEIYAMGAPQRHGQNIYKQNIAVYDQDFAKDLDGYDLTDDPDDDNDTPDVFEKFNEAGRNYNQNWAPVNSSYTGQQAAAGNTFDRHSTDFINSRENFYNKPLANLNWYSNLTENLSLYSTLYYSGGTGGGTGTLGSLVHQSYEGSYDHTRGKYYYYGSPWSWDWDATIGINRDSTHAWIDKKEYTKAAGQSIGILRNSRNDQVTFGALSKATYKMSDALSTMLGVDWRTAEIEHFREARDLLGGNYYINKTNDFDNTPELQKKVLGDRIDYSFTNTVDWLGFFGQGEFLSGPVSLYGMAGYSTIKYTYTNHFKAADTLANGDTDLNSGELNSETDWIGGYQVKGGASYRLTDDLDIFGNAGYVSRVPIFDNVINDRTGIKAEDPKNEKFLSIESGVNYWGLDGTLMLKSNFYYTSWKDKSVTVGRVERDGSEGIIFIQGMDRLHMGIEFEAAYQPIPLCRLDASAAIGNWKYANDVTGVYKDYTSGGEQEEEYNFYIKDLKSGDAPQTQLALIGSVFPVPGLSAQLVFRHYRNHYADWQAESRTNEYYPDATKNLDEAGDQILDRDGNPITGDRGVESWQAPNYSVIDFHAAYDLPFNLSGVKLQLFGHVFNALDATFIQDATDNSQYNSWDGDHDADDAEVFFGLPRTFNIGLRLSY